MIDVRAKIGTNTGTNSLIVTMHMDTKK